MLSELNFNAYKLNHFILKSWLFWNWKRHIHWLKNWCCFDFTSSSSWVDSKMRSKLLKLTFVFCSAPAASVQSVVDKILSLRIFQKQQLFKNVLPSKQQTVKWPKATKTFAKRPFLSKLNGWVPKHQNLILKV